VKEGQKVSAGERIAEMGRNDRNQAMLHFEIRLNGNPQDPRKYLP
jgi:lipoprotein NlpD